VKKQAAQPLPKLSKKPPPLHCRPTLLDGEPNSQLLILINLKTLKNALQADPPRARNNLIKIADHVGGQFRAA
jgi:hypothetical protein